MNDDVVCSCCGLCVARNDNVLLDVIPYPGDLGTGLCRSCGGDPGARDSRERLGFVATTFVDARIPLIADALSEKNRRHFLSLPYEKQADFVFRLVERGLLA